MLKKLKALAPLIVIMCLYWKFQAVVENNSSKRICGCSEEEENKSVTEFQLPSNVTLEQLNITGKAERFSLFFNRVPKVGSQSINSLLEKLQKVNRFSFVKDKVNQVEQIVMSREQERALATDISKHRSGSVYSKHVAMVDFKRYNLPTPIYVNMVRHPTDRLISWFYYIRAAWYIVDRKRLFPANPLPHVNWIRKDFDSCVQNPHDTECQYLQGDREGFGDHRRQSIFFCGMDPVCVPFNSKAAIAKAKENVERYYAVVGVLEDLNKTLTVFEHFVPRFFAGAVKTYWRTSSSVNRNVLKPPVSEHTRELVAANLTEEIDFYLWCKHRLNTMYYALERDGII